MLGELENIGINQDGFQLDLIGIVRHYIKEFYSISRKPLKAHGIEPHDIETLVYISLFNKNEEGVSNLDRYINKAKGLDSPLKYIYSVLRKTVRFRVIRCINECVTRDKYIKPIIYTDLDEEEFITSRIDGKKVNGFLCKVNLDDTDLMYKDIINSLPLKKLNLILDNKPLTNKGLINLYVEGYTTRELCDLLRTNEGENPTYMYMNRVKYNCFKDCYKYFDN